MISRWVMAGGLGIGGFLASDAGAASGVWIGATRIVAGLAREWRASGSEGGWAWALLDRRRPGARGSERFAFTATAAGTGGAWTVGSLRAAGPAPADASLRAAPPWSASIGPRSGVTGEDVGLLWRGGDVARSVAVAVGRDSRGEDFVAASGSAFGVGGEMRVRAGGAPRGRLRFERKGGGGRIGVEGVVHEEARRSLDVVWRSPSAGEAMRIGVERREGIARRRFAARIRIGGGRGSEGSLEAGAEAPIRSAGFASHRDGSRRVRAEWGAAGADGDRRVRVSATRRRSFDAPRATTELRAAFEAKAARGVRSRLDVAIGVRREAGVELRWRRGALRGGSRYELTAGRGDRWESWGGGIQVAGGRARFRCRVTRGEATRFEVEWGRRRP